MNRIRLSFILGVFSLLITHTCIAQRYPFTTITLKDGLPQCGVDKFIQDPSGYIWIATGGGICRYDGADFITYTYGSGLEASQIQDIAFDNNGRMWVATFGRGLAYYNGTTFQSIDKSAGFPYMNIQDILFSRTGDLWLTAHKYGVVRIVNGRFPHIQAFQKEAGTFICKKITELPNGDIVGFGREGYYVFDAAKDYQPHIVKTLSPLTNGMVDAEGGIWLGGKNLLLYQKSGVIIHKSSWLPPTTTVTDFLISGKTIYVSTTRGILKIKDNHPDWIDTRNGLSDDHVHTLFKDKFGNLWAGTSDGVTILNEKGMIHYQEDDNGKKFNAYTMMEDDSGSLWLGIINKGYFICSDTGLVKVPVAFDPSINPNQTFIDHRGNIFSLVNYNRVIKITGNKIVNEWNIPDTIFSANAFLPVNETEFLAGTTSGVFQVNIETKKMDRLDEIEDANFVYFFPDDHSNIWLVCDGGSVYKIKNGTAVNLTARINPQHDMIKHAAYDRFHQTLWFASEKGVFAWDGNKRYHLNTISGLGSNLNYCITVDSTGRIWSGNVKGISCIDIEKMSITNYGYDEGFLPIETNGRAALTDADGNVWIGTITGVSKILVDELNKDTIGGALRLQEIFVNEQLVYREPFKDFFLPGLKLKYFENNLRFVTSSLCYENAGEVEYTWKMEGYDKHWNTRTNHKEIEYFDLKPGRYKLHIKAINPNGFITNEIVLDIRISKPFWKTAVFYITEISLFILIVYLSFRFSAKSTGNRFGQVMTFLTILIIFESVMIYVSGYTDKYTNGIPVFQLVMNVVLAASLNPLEQRIKKFMLKRARKKK